MKFPYQKLSHFTLKYAWGIIALTLILTLAAAHKASTIKFKGDFIDLLPEDFSSVQGLNEIKKRAGGEGYLVLVLETDHIEKAKAFAEKLVPTLKTFPEINYVDYKYSKTFFEEHNLLYIPQKDLETVEARMKNKINDMRNKMNPFYIDLLDEKVEFNISDIKNKYSKADIKDYYITDDPKRLIIYMKPTSFSSNLEFSKRLLAKTEAAVESLNPDTWDPQMEVIYTGRYVTRIEQNTFMFEDLKRTSLFAITGVFLLLTIFTRQLFAMFFIGVPLLISIIYTLAFAAMTIGSLNLVTSVLIAILAGMGIDFGIHLYWRYLEERHRRRSVAHSIQTIQSMTGKPVILAGLTTAVAFFVLVPTSFIGFSQFGWIAGSGVIITLFNTFLLLPALLIISEKIRPIGPKLTAIEIDPGPTVDFSVAPKKYPRPYLTIGLFAAFSLFSLWSLFHVEFDYDFRKLSADKNGTLAIQEEISDAFGYALTPTIVYANSLDDIPTLTQGLHALRDQNPNTTIQEGLSLHSFVPENQEEKIPSIRKLGVVANSRIFRFLEGEEAEQIADLRRWASVKPFTVYDLPNHLKRQYNAVNNYPGSFLFIFPSIDLWHGKDVMRFASEIRQFKDRHSDANIHVASEALIFSDILSLIKSEGPLFLLASLIAVFLFLWIDIRRAKTVLLILTPLCVGILCLAGVMFLFGLKLNFMNSVIFPILLGLGIDHGVHIYHRYKESGPGSLLFVLRRTGSAICVSTLTTMIGFGSLMVAIHRGLNSLGLLSVVGLSLTLVSSVTLLPAIIQVIENRKDTAPELSKIRKAA